MKKTKIHNHKYIKVVSALLFATTIAISQQYAHKTPLSEYVPPKILGATTVAARGESLPTPVPLPVAQKPLDVSRLKAKSFLAYDSFTGQILAAQNTTEPMAIASLTKLMTLFVAYNNTRPEQEVVIVPEDTKTVSPVLHLVPGDTVHMIDLLEGMMIGSANDAALAVARATAELTGRQFVDLMNETALNLGMTQTAFANPIGFDSARNFSTAADLKILVEAVRNLPILDMTGAKTEFTFRGESGWLYKIRASNKLVGKYPGLLAIKTGSSPAANGAMVTKISQDGHECIFIILDSPDREGDTLLLRDAVFGTYVWQ